MELTLKDTTMTKNERRLAYLITLMFWAICIDMTIENEGPIWLAVAVSNFATLISVVTIIFIMSYAKE